MAYSFLQAQAPVAISQIITRYTMPPRPQALRRRTFSTQAARPTRTISLETRESVNQSRDGTAAEQDGQRSAALVHFEIAKRVLKEELEVAPREETLNLLARIQH